MTTIYRPNQGGSNTAAIIKEAEWGKTPAGAFQQIPYTQIEINYAEEEILDDTISNDDLRIDTQGGTQSIGGSIQANLVGKYHRDLMASAMKSAWTAGDAANTSKLKSGGAVESISVEIHSADKNLNELFDGIVANTMAVNATSALATINFGVMGRKRTLGTASVATSTVPFTTDAKSMRLAGGHVKVNGTRVKLTAFQLDTNSNYQGNYSADDDVVDHLSSDRSDKTGSITVWHDDQSFENMLAAGTEFSLDALIGDGAYSYQFIGTRCKVTAVTKSFNTLGSITKTVTYRILKDDATGTDLQIIETVPAA